MILLVAEVEEFKANPNDVQLVLLLKHSLIKEEDLLRHYLFKMVHLQVGDPIVVGNAFGRVRAMVNDIGRRVKVAGPSTPVEITGLNEVPQAGDRFMVFKDEKKARQIGESRAQKHSLHNVMKNQKLP